MSPAPQWITFDLGGTLLVPTPSVGEIYAEILARHGLAASSKALNERFPSALRRWTHALSPRMSPRDERGIWRSIVQETLGPDLEISPDMFEPAFRDLFDAFAEGRRWRILPGVRSCLTTLRKRGIRLAALSNSDSRMRRVLADLALDDFFEAIFLSGELGWEKPDLTLFTYVTRVLDVPTSSILHIGDSERHDLVGARQVGWSTYLVKSGTGLPPPAELPAEDRQTPPSSHADE